MNKYYRSNCPICNEFIGIDMKWVFGGGGTRVILPPEMFIMHDGRDDHRVFFLPSNDDKTVRKPQGGRRSNRRSAIA